MSVLITEKKKVKFTDRAGLDRQTCHWIGPQRWSWCECCGGASGGVGEESVEESVEEIEEDQIQFWLIYIWDGVLKNIGGFNEIKWRGNLNLGKKFRRALSKS